MTVLHSLSVAAAPAFSNEVPVTNFQFVTAATLLCVLATSAIANDVQQLTNRMHHLRSQDGPREWSEFPEVPEGLRLELAFDVAKNNSAYCLELRQEDIKQSWHVRLNGNEVAALHRDENDMVVYFDVAAGSLKDGANVLTVEPSRSRAPDDIRVGEIALHSASRKELLNESWIAIRGIESTPARITIINDRGSLQETGLATGEGLAVRPGTIYSYSKGYPLIPVPAGRYTVYVGRGFEYSLRKLDLTTQANSVTAESVILIREVPTEGYVACDTHVHTRTHSGHGDSTVQERMITLAAEGIELPIATDHNVHIDHRPFAKEAGVERFLTPVIGNEVTTPVGHFNIWPVKPGAPPPEYKLQDWAAVGESIGKVPGVKAIILNHARDVHSGVRPFGPKLFNDAVGERVDGWKLPANAMEVVNSSANQTDILQMFHDWMSLLNRGLHVTPVGSSDSHDVARHFVGQGRTYIRCDDSDPGSIDIDAAAESFAQGRVLVSCGLIAELTVDDKYRSGDLVTGDNSELDVHIRVLGPSWTAASHIWLYSNGERIHEIDLTKIELDKRFKRGVLWDEHWQMDRPQHDVNLVAIAVGPGIEGPWWRTAKPYQPTSPEWTPTSIGCSGAVWIDGDGDGQRSSARDYAAKVFSKTNGDFSKLLAILENYDTAVAAQAAHLYQADTPTGSPKLSSPEASKLVAGAKKSTQLGIRRYLDAWRKNQIAASGQ